MFDQLMEIFRTSQPLDIIQDAPPFVYFILLVLAGLGIPVSEDLLIIWAGGLLGRGAPHPEFLYLIALYFGVIASDMLTFYVGRLTHDTFGGRIRRLLLRQQNKIDRAVSAIQKHGDRIGFIQRFSLGARLPITLVAGYSGVSPLRFMLGSAFGACLTLPIQLTIGYLARDQMMQVVEFLSNYGRLVGAAIMGSLVTLIYLKMRDIKSHHDGDEKE